MTEKTMETAVAVIGEKLDRLLTENAEAKESRKAQYQATESLRHSVQAIEFRITTVEKFVAESQPTLTEFIAIKNRVEGAGIAGRALWGLAGFSIGAVAWIALQLKHFVGP